MKSQVIQIRDIDKIEKELNSGKVGIMGFSNKKEIITQLVVPFLYANKNIYFFFDSDDESYGSLLLESRVNFTLYKSDSHRKNASAELQVNYKFTQISFMGKLKEEDDPKVVDNLYKRYLQKYSYNLSRLTEAYLEQIKLVFLDTEEIQATEVTGL